MGMGPVLVSYLCTMGDTEALAWEIVAASVRAVGGDDIDDSYGP